MNNAFFNLPKEKQQRILKAGIHEFSEKTFSEASTDAITKACGISKGLLFHYFGSKNEFYLHCVEKAIQQLTLSADDAENHLSAENDSFSRNHSLKKDLDFFEIIFNALDEKLQLCSAFPDEMHLVNMASRENCSAVREQKNLILQTYTLKARKMSLSTYQEAIHALPLRNPEDPGVLDALMLYTGAIMNQYLAQYQNSPDVFFREMDVIKVRLKKYLDYMLQGICNQNMQIG